MEPHSPSIYFTEDDPLMARMFTLAFKSKGFSVRTAADGEQAIADIGALAEPPDIIVLDVMMPKRSGFEVLEYIKQHSPYQHVPVVMLSNLTGKEDAERARALGAAGYLIKSQYRPQEVAEKIKEFIADQTNREVKPS